MKKGLYIVATPIGNLGDISTRALETLKEAEVIACEDTRITKKLFSLLGLCLNKKFITLHDHNEDKH
ncbi:MAG: rRNA (cytidine-2'-O-)-methyltransferase, partial [Alphaproteobacteria bacterium]|nr:rRNA (cytidine-2'-O-)-methyltransferase [Alphaproteobacteria bacterium]